MSKKPFKLATAISELFTSEEIIYSLEWELEEILVNAHIQSIVNRLTGCLDQFKQVAYEEDIPLHNVITAELQRMLVDSANYSSSSSIGHNISKQAEIKAIGTILRNYKKYFGGLTK